MLRYVLHWSAVLAAVAGFVSVPAGNGRAATPESLAHYIMALSHELQDETEAAFLEYQKAVLLDPSSFVAQMRLGSLGSHLGRYPVAVQAFRAASLLDPDDLQARYLLALAYSAVKDLEHAFEQYAFVLQALTAKDPRDVASYIQLGDLYAMMGKADLAVAQFEKVLTIDPGNTDALLQVGSFYLDSEKRADGRMLLERCIKTNPGQADCLNALGYAYAEDNVRLDEAREMVIKALSMEPDHPAYLDSLGWVYYRQGKWQDALDLFQKAVAQVEDPVIYDHMGDTHEKLGQMDKALLMWQKASALDESADLKAKITRANNSLKKK